MKKHINIPVFIPHMGCPNQCVFCNQRVISGTCSFDESSVNELISPIARYAEENGISAEIAYFGGSFTGIDRDLMIRLLDLAEEYVKRGSVIGIRMSTRPDYINDEIINILSRYTVSAVELGVQSMSDAVLSASKRGHTSRDTKNAVRLLREAGIPWVGQMMIGLPCSTREDERETAEYIASEKAVGARIYPTVVFRGSELEAMMRSGVYCPIRLSDAVSRGADALEVFARDEIFVLRIGLCESENLHSGEAVGGANHPAVGEMIISEVYYRKAASQLERLDCAEKAVLIEVPRGEISKMSGQKRVNKLRIHDRYNVKNIKIVENPSLMRYNIKCSII